MILIKSVYASCPVCVVTVGGGLWLAKRLGLDDLIAAIWIGSLTTAFAVALADKFKLIKLPKPKISWTILFYIFTIFYLQISGNLNNPYCKIWGVCKIWLGITIGTIAFWLGYATDIFLRSKNNQKIFFPYQKVVMPVSATLLASLIFYWLTC